MVLRFPQTANHELLALISLLVIALGEGRPALRWLVPIVFLWSGIQKAISGCWLEGEMLAVSALESERFMWFQLVVPRGEMTALRAMSPSSIGSGPFHFEGAIPLAISNGIWILEIVLPVLLLLRKTRRPAAILLLSLLAGIELLAREWIFGLISAGLIALFLERDAIMKVKRRSTTILLCAVALWPLVQITLVRSRGVDPWELWGFGMYTCPRLDSEVRAFTGDRPLPKTEALRAYEEAWRHIGRLASPRRAARSYFEIDPKLEAVRFRLNRLELDASDRVALRGAEVIVSRADL
jgi:hypothetical protein